MEIRRVEPELVPPAVASDKGSQVELRRQPVQQRRKKSTHPDTEDKDEATNDAEQEATSTITYDTDGHVQERQAPGKTHRQFDARA